MKFIADFWRGARQNGVCVHSLVTYVSIVMRSNAQEGRTALIWAVFNHQTDCARLLLDAGADREAKDLVCVGGSVCGF
jgi:ankyrin repeat protein